jgi:hypothetical protein
MQTAAIFRAKLSVFSLVFALLAAFPALAEEIAVYGPVQFTRGTGAPVAEQVGIPSSNTAVSYRLRIVNGGLADTARLGAYVGSAEISWNGVLIAGPNNFNQNSGALTLPVAAHAVNTLSVELQGQPGGSISVELLRDNQAPMANAGADRTVFTGGAALLDGSASGDGDGDSLS